MKPRDLVLGEYGLDFPEMVKLPEEAFELIVNMTNIKASSGINGKYENYYTNTVVAGGYRNFSDFIDETEMQAFPNCSARPADLVSVALAKRLLVLLKKVQLKQDECPKEK